MYFAGQPWKMNTAGIWSLSSQGGSVSHITCLAGPVCAYALPAGAQEKLRVAETNTRKQTSIIKAEGQSSPEAFSSQLLSHPFPTTAPSSSRDALSKAGRRGA